MINCPIKTTKDWVDTAAKYGLEKAYKLSVIPNSNVKQTDFGYVIGDTIILNKELINVYKPVYTLIPLLTEFVDISQHYEYPLNEYNQPLINDNILSFMEYVKENEAIEVNYLLNTDDIYETIGDWLLRNKIEDIAKLNPSKKLITNPSKIMEILLKNNIPINDDVLNYYEYMYDMFKPSNYEEIVTQLNEFLSNNRKKVLTINNHTIRKTNEGLVQLDDSKITTDDENLIISYITDTYDKRKSEWLLYIINNSENVAHVEIAKLFYDKLKYINNSIVKTNTKEYNWFNNITKEISITNPNQQTFLHEFAHNLTSHLLERLDNLTDNERNFLSNILEYYYIANGKQLTEEDKEYFFNHYQYNNYKVYSNYHYGLTDIKEFIAESLTNPVFQKYLANIPYQNQSVFHKIYDIIVKYLGRLIHKKDNLLNVVVSEVLNYIDSIDYNVDTQLKTEIKQSIAYMHNNRNNVSLKSNYLVVNNTPILKLPNNLIIEDVDEILNNLVENYNVNLYDLYNKVQRYVNDIELSKDIMNYMYEQKNFNFSADLFTAYIHSLNQSTQKAIFNRLNSENRYSKTAKLTNQLKSLHSLYNKLQFKEQLERRNSDFVKKIMVDNNVNIVINKNNSLIANKDKYTFTFTDKGIEIHGKDMYINQIADTLYNRYGVNVYYNDEGVKLKPITALEQKIKERKDLFFNEEEITIINNCN